VLTVQVGSRLVGVAAFERLTGDTAEVALLVADDYHERGIGTQLLEHLAQVARNNGIRRFQADLLGENDPALRMVRDLGWAAQMRFHDGIGRVVADLAPDTAVVRLPLMASSWMKTEIGGVVGGVHRCRTGGCGTGGRDGGVDRGPGAIGGGGVVDATGGRGDAAEDATRIPINADPGASDESVGVRPRRRGARATAGGGSTSRGPAGPGSGGGGAEVGGP